MTESPTYLGVLNICFSRYRLPLDPNQKKKFGSLSEMAELHVVGLARDLQPRHEHVLFDISTEHESPDIVSNICTYDFERDSVCRSDTSLTYGSIRSDR